MGMLSEFMEFLKEYKVIPLAIAFIMGVAATALVTSLVNDIIMPMVGVLIPGGEWRTATWALGPVKFGIGPFVGQLINFIIIAFVVFMIAKTVLKEEKVAKK
jgi:large conductance mechanosensitive channel